MKKLAKLAAVLFLMSPVVAAAKPEPLPKQVSDMECLVGNWKGGGSLAMGQTSSKLQATWTCKRTSAQFGLLCSFHVTGVPGVAAYEETDLFGFEPNTNAYHWYSVTNAGETHDHVGQVPNSNTLQFVFTGTQDGKALKEVIDLAFEKNEKHLRGRAETFIAGASASVMQLELDK
jgi:hypothetical protein